MTLLSNPQDHHEQVNINIINIFTTFTKFESIQASIQNQGIKEGYVKLHFAFH